MKRFAMALALMCVLSTSIIAGNMPTVGKSEEPPSPGNMPTVGAASSASSNDPANQVIAQSGVITTVILTIIDLTI